MSVEMRAHARTRDPPLLAALILRQLYISHAL
jgi:hypothetical protein